MALVAKSVSDCWMEPSIKNAKAFTTQPKAPALLPWSRRLRLGGKRVMGQTLTQQSAPQRRFPPVDSTPVSVGERQAPVWRILLAAR